MPIIPGATGGHNARHTPRRLRGPLVSRMLMITVGVRLVRLDDVFMDSSSSKDIHARLEQLRLEHRDLDMAISRLAEDPHVNELQLTRLKKRKLQLKDYIAKLESLLIPDLDA
jgi:hypothetical protein